MNVQFDENYSDLSSGNYQPTNSGGGNKMAAWLINKGIVKDEKAAQITLITIMIICLGLAFYLFKQNPANSRPKIEVDPNAPTIEDLIRQSQNASNRR